jgi:hypothetical protein
MKNQGNVLDFMRKPKPGVGLFVIELVLVDQWDVFWVVLGFDL